MTPTLSISAKRAVIYANGARARHAASRHKARKAQLLVALVLIQEIRSKGGHVSRRTEQALRGKQ